jgi:hypothetical protein
VRTGQHDVGSGKQTGVPFVVSDGGILRERQAQGVSLGRRRPAARALSSEFIHQTAKGTLSQGFKQVCSLTPVVLHLAN